MAHERLKAATSELLLGLADMLDLDRHGTVISLNIAVATNVVRRGVTEKEDGVLAAIKSTFGFTRAACFKPLPLDVCKVIAAFAVNQVQRICSPLS